MYKSFAILKLYITIVYLLFSWFWVTPIEQINVSVERSTAEVPCTLIRSCMRCCKGWVKCLNSSVYLRHGHLKAWQWTWTTSEPVFINVVKWSLVSYIRLQRNTVCSETFWGICWLSASFLSFWTLTHSA